jgi:hypothetical protein
VVSTATSGRRTGTKNDVDRQARNLDTAKPDQYRSADTARGPSQSSLAMNEQRCRGPGWCKQATAPLEDLEATRR